MDHFEAFKMDKFSGVPSQPFIQGVQFISLTLFSLEINPVFPSQRCGHLFLMQMRMKHSFGPHKLSSYTVYQAKSRNELSC